MDRREILYAIKRLTMERELLERRIAVEVQIFKLARCPMCHEELNPSACADPWHKEQSELATLRGALGIENLFWR